LPITIVNRHYPPNLGITGESAWDLAKYLIEKHQIEVHIVHIDRSYDGGGQVREPVGITHKIKTIYEGKNKFLRFIAGPLDGFLLIWKAIRLKKGTIICMTSPPLLPFWASVLFSIFKREWILWSMDLFPEGFVSTGQIKESNWIYRLIIKLTYRNPPQKLIALGQKQAEFVVNKYRKPLEKIILPCGVLLNQERETKIPEWKKDDGKIYLGYAGNVGDAHSDEFLISIIKHLNPTRQHLVLALYGTKAHQVLEFAQNQDGITILKNIPRSQLHFIDIHLVSLLKTWTHVAVPSKAISSVCAGGSILFCGSSESDSWYLNQSAGWLIEENEKIDEQIEDFLKNITPEQVKAKRMNAEKVVLQLNQYMMDAYEALSVIGH
jgi:hypothetical protein